MASQKVVFLKPWKDGRVVPGFVTVMDGGEILDQRLKDGLVEVYEGGCPVGGILSIWEANQQVKPKKNTKRSVSKKRVLSTENTPEL